MNLCSEWTYEIAALDPFICEWGPWCLFNILLIDLECNWAWVSAFYCRCSSNWIYLFELDKIAAGYLFELDIEQTIWSMEKINT